MKILYVSYSCDPYNGSEDQIGWNIPLASYSSGNEVYVITKAEHRRNIEDYYVKRGISSKIKYYYIDVPVFYKKLLRGIAYSMRIIIWQSKAFKLARNICEENGIDIIHQVAPVEFRAYGDYGKIKNSIFVAGPIGGGYTVPKPLNWYVKEHPIQEGLRKILNNVSFSLLRKSGKISKTKHIWMTNYETYNAFQEHDIIIDEDRLSFQCDVGIEKDKIEQPVFRKNRSTIVFFVPGRLVYRKGHNLLFDAIEKAINEEDDVIFRIAGIGPEEKKLRKRVGNSRILSKHVTFLGQIPFTQMKDEYRESDAVILPSLTEATGTVVIEGLSYGKPVITGDFFGAKLLLDNSAGWLYHGNTVEEIVKSFADSLYEALHNKELLINKGYRAREISLTYTWDEKVKKFNSIYSNLIRQ